MVINYDGCGLKEFIMWEIMMLFMLCIVWFEIGFWVGGEYKFKDNKLKFSYLIFAAVYFTIALVCFLLKLIK